jgi:hypothetical protein
LLLLLLLLLLTLPILGLRPQQGRPLNSPLTSRK